MSKCQETVKVGTRKRVADDYTRTRSLIRKKIVLTTFFSVTRASMGEKKMMIVVMVTFAVDVKLKLCSNIDVNILFQRRIWGLELTSNEKGRG